MPLEPTVMAAVYGMDDDNGGTYAVQARYVSAGRKGCTGWQCCNIAFWVVVSLAIVGLLVSLPWLILEPS